MADHWLNVRDVEKPHKILGELRVPYKAAVGELPVVNFQAWSGPLHNGRFTILALNVHLFIAAGQREFCFQMTPGQLDDVVRRLQGVAA